MVVCPVIQFKAIKGHALMTDRNLREIRSNLAVEAIAIHAEIAGRVTKSDQPRRKRD